MTGRKPIPSGIKALRGNPGHHPRTRTPPIARGPVPEAPGGLSSEALREWNRLATELSACGLLTALDRGCLAAYCIAWATLTAAEALIGDDGILVTDDNHVRRKHPAVAIARDTMVQIRSLGSELGLSPVARTRLRQSGEAPDALETFLTIPRGNAG